MKQFQYTAVDSTGQRVSGSLAAADWDTALELLSASGLRECRLVTDAASGTLLGTADALELATYLSELSTTGLPLSSTLRELGRDSTSPALRRVIDQLTERMNAGQPLDAAIEELGDKLPAHVRRLLVSAARSGRMSDTLAGLLAHEQRVDSMGQRLRQAVAYPLLLAAMLLAWLYFMTLEVLPQMMSVFVDMNSGGYDRSVMPPAMLLVARWYPLVATTALVVLAIVLFLVWLSGGWASISRLLAKVPIVGPCWRSRSLADFSGLLAGFVAEQLPLGEALTLTAQSARDPAMRQASLAVARQVEQGTELAAAVQRSRAFPAVFSQWVDWGQRQGALSGALGGASTMYREQFELRLQYLRVLLPALIFALIAGSAIVVASGVFTSMFDVINMLSWNEVPSGTIDNDNFWIVLAACVFVAIMGGCTLLLARIVPPDEILGLIAETLIKFFGYFLIADSALGFCLLVIGGFGILVWLLLMAGWLRAAWRYRQMQRHSLWAALSLAAECRAPLAPIALAFADDQRGWVATAARKLGQQLTHGANLSEAIELSPRALPADAPLAVRVGTDAGDLLGALHASRGKADAPRPLMPPALIWLLLVAPVCLAALLFMQIKIMPAFIKIFDDFDTNLPALTVTLIQIVNLSYVWEISAAVLAIVPLLIWLQWRGTLQPRMPLLKRVSRWLEVGPILRLLGLVTRQGRPLTDTLETMARMHPHRWLRSRLRAALRDVDQGYTWQESLRRRRVLTSNDLAVLTAAQRNGNLPWALEELGNSFHRRAEFQMRAAGEFALPLLLVSVGTIVAFITIAYFLPLVNLIVNLS